MTLRTFIKVAKGFRRAAEKLQPGSVRKRPAGGSPMKAYEDRRTDLDEEIARAEADIRNADRRADRLEVLASRAADLLLSIKAYEARMANSKATRRWDWPAQAEKVADELREVIASTRDPGSLRTSEVDPLHQD